jgi:hypothetical protein
LESSPSASSLSRSEVSWECPTKKTTQESEQTKLHIESPAIGHPHKDPLFLIKEESVVELSDDLLVPVVPELQQICNSMEVTSLWNPVEVHILLVPHVIYMHKLMLDHRRSLWVEHSLVPVLMKESLEPLISPSLLREVIVGLIAEGDEVHWVLLAVVHHLPVGVSDRGPDLQALRLIGRLGSATTRRRILRGGLLSKRVGSCPLGKLLQVSSGSLARARDTGLLTLLGTPLLSFTGHSLQERIENRSENKI